MKIVDLKHNRIIATCIFNDTVDKPSIFQAVFDTGARYTVIRADRLNRNWREYNFKNNETIILTGVIRGTTYKAYKIHVKQLTVYDIDLGEQDIWITFNKTAGDDVLGFDIIKQLAFYFNNMESKMYLFKFMSEMEKYMLNDECIKNTASAFNSLYNKLQYYKFLFLFI